MQNDDYEIKDSEFIKAKGLKKSASKNLTNKDFDEFVYDKTNTPITKEQISSESIDHKAYTLASNKIAMSNAENKES